MGDMKWQVGKIWNQWFAKNPDSEVSVWFDTWREAYDFATVYDEFF